MFMIYFLALNLKLTSGADVWPVDEDTWSHSVVPGSIWLVPGRVSCYCRPGEGSGDGSRTLTPASHLGDLRCGPGSQVWPNSINSSCCGCLGSELAGVYLCLCLSNLSKPIQLAATFYLGFL